MKCFTLSMVILAMVMGTLTLETYAGGKRHFGGHSGGRSHSHFSGSRRHFKSNSFNRKFNSHSMKSSQNFNRRITNSRIKHNTFSKVQPKGSTFQRHNTLKKVHSGFNHRKPGNSFTRPVKKPFTGNTSLKPKPGQGSIKFPGKKPFDNIKPRPRPGKPLAGKPILPKPGQGKMHHNGHHNGHHHHWHNHRPRYSWWWYNYCTPLRTCVPANYQYCNYVYPTCDYVAPSGVVVEDVRWFLGLKGLMLPGKGIGIETIAANSPAAAVGLKPGMVITRCNGVVITDNEVFGQVIAQSGGVLEMELLESIEGEPLQATVQMTQLPAASF